MKPTAHTHLVSTKPSRTNLNLMKKKSSKTLSKTVTNKERPNQLVGVESKLSDPARLVVSLSLLCRRMDGDGAATVWLITHL
jgi:hypothetical protein